MIINLILFFAKYFIFRRFFLKFFLVLIIIFYIKKNKLMDANKIGKTFKLTKKLGSGAFGEIFLGINVMLKKI